MWLSVEKGSDRMRNLAVVASFAAVALVNSATAELLNFDHLPSTFESSIPAD